MTAGPTRSVTIKHIESDFEIADLANAIWDASAPVRVTDHWSGERAADGRHFSACLLWSERALYARFDAKRTEDLVVSDEPDTERKTLGLWEFDVCELYVAPNAAEPRQYFEFEIAPTGEWLDLAIDSTGGERVTDWEYDSGMKAFACIDKRMLTMAIAIPWKAFGKTPAAGDAWLGNLFRCVGAGNERGYLAFSPTHTAEPNFHVPEKFVEFRFLP